MNTNNVEIRIKRLVLRGTGTTDGAGIARHTEQELARLFGRLGVPPSLARSGSKRSVDAGKFTVAPKSSSQDIGARLARQLYGGMSK